MKEMRKRDREYYGVVTLDLLEITCPSDLHFVLPCSIFYVLYLISFGYGVFLLIIEKIKKLFHNNTILFDCFFF